MAIFACFAPPFAVKKNESKGISKASNGSKKRKSKRDRRVKPIDIVSPSISDGIKNRKSKSGLRTKPIDAVIPTTVDGNKKSSSKSGFRVMPIDIASLPADGSKKKKNKWGLRVKPIYSACPSTADGSKKRRSKWGLRVKPIDIASPSAENGGKKKSSKVGLQFKPVDIVCPSTENDLKELSFPVAESFPSEEKILSVSLKMVSDDTLAGADSKDGVSYEMGDDHDEIRLKKGDRLDLHLQHKGELVFHGSNTDLSNYVLEEEKTDEGVTLQAVIASGHASDPLMEQAVFMNSTILKRSCSNIETRQDMGLVKSSKRSNSYSNIQNLSENGKVEITYGTPTTSLSVCTACSADHEMLMRQSSCRVLPSRSRKIWRKLFLWSTSNLPKYRAPERLISIICDTNQKEMFSSDMCESDKRLENTQNITIELEKQWTAFSSRYSHIDRVNAWVNSLEDCSFFPVDVDGHCHEIEDEQTSILHHLETGESSVRKCSDAYHLEMEEVVRPNNIIQSLNSFSSVAHISSIGLKVLPSISAFVYLRSANLSGNRIIQITPGCLPKSLHTLDLSRNKISNIEGLRDLERLRVLNLSYNRITRIGHGLSSCTLLKELYLAGNKISSVEGLHRILKLAVLDLSFNKITTTQALGQLVANYNCLLALNLIGNPIQTNIGDDQLKKEVSSLLPYITYLNKQSIKPHKVHEVPTSSVIKAALGDGPRRKMTRRLCQDSGSPSKRRIGEGSSRAVKRRSKSMHPSPRRR